MKIKQKIIGIILISTLGLAVVIGGVSIWRSSNILQQEAEDKLSYISQSNSNRIEERLEGITAKAEYVSSTIYNTADETKLETDEDYLVEYKETTIDRLIKRTAQMDGVEGAHFYFNPNLLDQAHDVWYVKSEGDEDYERQEETSIDAFDPESEDMAWYYEPIEQEKPVWSDPYESWTGDTIIISYTKAIVKDGVLLGVVGLDIPFSEISQPIEEVGIYDSGYAFLLNNDYDFLSHPRYDQEQNLDEFESEGLAAGIETMETEDTGIVDYTLDSEARVMGYSRLSNGWILGVTVPENELLAQMNQLSFFLLGLCLLGGLFAGGISYFFGDRLSASLNKVTDYAKLMADGDFSHSVPEEYTARSDELGDLARGFNQINSSMQEMIREIKSFIADLSAHSQQLSASAEEGTATIKSTEELISSMSATIQQISTSAKEVTAFAQESSSKTEVGRESIGSSLDSMEQIKESVAETRNSLDQLDSTTDEIDEISGMINNIAEQINLLALNAAIEAARAGSNQQESGQGFAVVAEEIRELAEETNQATEKVASLIGATRNQTDDSLESIAKVESNVATGVEKTNQTKELVHEIQKTSHQTAEKIEQTANATQNLAESSQEIDRAATDIEEMSSKIAQSSQELTEMAQNLQMIAEKFEI
ncbi:MAG: methyl-accepting chemotaxis protein [Halanaerobacter sp.]